MLDQLETLRICTGYTSKDGSHWDHPMANISHLKHSQAIYEEMPGWKTSIAGIRKYEDLPEACRNYVERIEELCGAPIDVVSTGPDRADVVVRRPLI